MTQPSQPMSSERREWLDGLIDEPQKFDTALYDLATAAREFRDEVDRLKAELATDYQRSMLASVREVTLAEAAALRELVQEFRVVVMFERSQSEAARRPTDKAEALLLRIREALSGTASTVLLDELTRLRTEKMTELGRQREGFIAEQSRIEQVLGRELGMTRFCDDQKNWPGATDEDGVCVGEHTALTLAMTAADELTRLRERVKELEGR